MTEIEFLPAWYKNGKRRQFGYRTQYVALVGMLAVMVVWSLTTGRSISKARAELKTSEQVHQQAKTFSDQVAQVKLNIARLRKRESSLHEIDSRVHLPSLLGELSFLLDKRIVLKKMELIAEKFEQAAPAGLSAVGAIRMANINLDQNRDAPIGNVKFKVIINGVAADSSDVAALICQLEDSPYFKRVVPSFSRDTRIVGAAESTIPSSTNTAAAVAVDNTIPASEFEVVCYLANFSRE